MRRWMGALFVIIVALGVLTPTTSAHALFAWTSQFTDAFTGSFLTSLPTHDSTWSCQSGTAFVLGIANDVITNNSTVGTCHITTTLANKQAVYGTTSGSTFQLGLAVRLDSAGTSGYVVRWRGNVFADISVFRRSSGSNTELGSPTTGISGSSSELRVEIDASENITVYVGGSSVKTESDSTHAFTSGSGGLYDPVGDNSIMFLNFGAEDEAAASSFPAAIINNPIRCCFQSPHDLANGKGTWRRRHGR